MLVKVLNHILWGKLMAILAWCPIWTIFSNPFQMNKNEIIALCLQMWCWFCF